MFALFAALFPYGRLPTQSGCDVFQTDLVSVDPFSVSLTLLLSIPEHKLAFSCTRYTTILFSLLLMH